MTAVTAVTGVISVIQSVAELPINAVRNRSHAAIPPDNSSSSTAATLAFSQIAQQTSNKIGLQSYRLLKIRHGVSNFAQNDQTKTRHLYSPKYVRDSARSRSKKTAANVPPVFAKLSPDCSEPKPCPAPTQ